MSWVTSGEMEKIKIEQLLYAEEVVKNIKESKDKRVQYRDSRPIMDLKHMWETSVDLYADRAAFHVKDKPTETYRQITYGEADKDIKALMTALVALDLKGKNIAIIGDNSYQWAISYLAVVCGTGVVVPLDKELPDNELELLVRTAEVECVLYAGKYSKVFQSMREKENIPLKCFINLNGRESNESEHALKDVLSLGRKRREDGDSSFEEAFIQRDEMNILLFTSGTTGISKGVMLSHGNIVEDLMAAPTLLKVMPEDVFFSVLPVHHTYECTCGFLMPLYKGASIAYCEGLKYIVKNLSEVKPTIFLGVPLIFESLYRKIWQNVRKSGKEKTLKKMISLNNRTKKIGMDLAPLLFKKITAVFGGRMRMMICGGAAIDPNVLQGIRDFGIPALQGYGLTECSPICALNPDGYIKNHSAGYPLPGFHIKIYNPDGETGIGEICTAGKNVMMGYYRNEEASREVLLDGWFHTGDLGYLDEDGYVIITGRQKNVIITKNGKNVFPEEIESYLGKIPFVAECLVWGKDTHDGKDTVIAATVRLEEEEVKEMLGENYTKEQALNTLWKHLNPINEALPYFKRIRHIILREEEFEKTTGKKIKRFVESNKE